jgi:hypothetical protein
MAFGASECGMIGFFNCGYSMYSRRVKVGELRGNMCPSIFSPFEIDVDNMLYVVLK